MRRSPRLALVALGALGCSGDRALSLSFPEGIELILAVRGAEVLAVSRSDPPLELPSAPGSALLGYARDLDAYALARDAERRLLLAAPSAPEAERWPLPTPDLAWTEREDAFEPSSGPAILEALTLAVPPPPCGRLELTSTDTLEVPERNVSLTSVANVGDTVALATFIGEPRNHARVFVARPGLVSEVALDDESGQTFVVAARGELRMIRLADTRVRSYRLAEDGSATLSAELPSSGRPWLERARSGEDGAALYAYAAEWGAFRLDLASGAWRRLARAPSTSPSECTAFRFEQGFVLDGPARGAASFAGAWPLRFASTASASSVIPEAVAGPPCQSAYLPLAGVELVTRLTIASNAPKSDVSWRIAGAWRDAPFPSQLFDPILTGDRALALDGTLDDVALVGFEPKRPDRAPRICAHLGVADARIFAFDGERGVVIVHPAPLQPLKLARFRRVD